MDWRIPHYLLESNMIIIPLLMIKADQVALPLVLGRSKRASPLFFLEGTECFGKKLQNRILVLSLEYNKITQNSDFYYSFRECKRPSRRLLMLLKADPAKGKVDNVLETFCLLSHQI